MVSDILPLIISCRRKPTKQPPLPDRISSLCLHISMARFAIFLFSFFLLHHRVTSDLSDEQKQALLSFIQKVKHRSDYSWKESDQPVCGKWKGVRCDPTNTSVIHLRLPGASLIGEIPPETIGKLSSLRVLSLHDNGLTGDLPQDFSNLVVLTGLVLHNNKLTGPLPDLKLEILDVRNNKFDGRVPRSLSNLPASVFSGNIDLCGEPLGRICNGSYPPRAPEEPPSAEEKPKGKTKDKRLIVGISVGSALLLVILLFCLRKKITKTSKQLPVKKSASSKAGTSTEGERNSKFVSFDNGVYSFDLEDLYRASPEVLGKGSVGTSYKVAPYGGPTVVVKNLKDVEVTKEEFESRMEVLGKMKIEYVVPLRAYYYSEHEKFLVYDYMPAGSLFALLHGSRDLGQTRLDWDYRMKIALSLARGVAYLHEFGKVVHGNIKSSNILLRQETNKVASVSDYGLNTLFGGLTSLNHQVTGYTAPEVVNSRKFTYESDVYSFGVVLLEILTGKDPNKTLLLGKERIEFSMWVQLVVNQEPKAEVFDVKLRRHENTEEQMVRLLRIAKDCVFLVPDQRPAMQKVVRMIEDMNRVETDDSSMAFGDTPSTDTRDTPSTITP